MRMLSVEQAACRANAACVRSISRRRCLSQGPKRRDSLTLGSERAPVHHAHRFAQAAFQFLRLLHEHTRVDAQHLMQFCIGPTLHFFDAVLALAP